MKIEAKDIRLKYGNIEALSGVTVWEIYSGEIHALVGHNGSGKTSFLRCLAGNLSNEASVTGSLFIDENEVLNFWNQETAFQTGLRFSPQEPLFVRDLTAIENIILGKEQKRSFFFWNRQADESFVTELIEMSGLSVPLNKAAMNLTASEKQKVGILRALSGLKKDGILLLDEPTTQLTKKEVDRLFNYLSSLTKKLNVGVLIASHHLSELKEIADKVTKFEKGYAINTYHKSEFEENEELVFGKSNKKFSFAPSSGQTSEILKANLKVTFRDRDFGIDLSIKNGEVGVVYAPEEDLLDDLFMHLAGLPTVYCWDGNLHFCGQLLNGKHNWERRGLGIGFVSADRISHGVFQGMSIYENLMIDKNTAPHWIFGKSTLGKRRAIIAKVGLENVDLTDDIITLSGGFMQRLILAREWAQEPQLLILRNPTQGLDSEKREFLLEELQVFINKNGSAVILGNPAADMDVKGTIQFKLTEMTN